MCDFVIITNYREWFRASDQLITLFLGLFPILWLQKWSWFDIKQNAFDPKSALSTGFRILYRRVDIDSVSDHQACNLLCKRS